VLAQDVALALFVTVMQVQGVLVRGAEPGERPLTDLADLGLFLLVATGLVLVVRRRWPVAVFVTTALGSIVYFTLEFPDGPGWLALFVALYTLTAHGDGRRSVVIAGVGIAVLAVAWLVAARDIEPQAAIGWVFFRIGASVMSAALGESVRTRRVIAAEAVERAERAERTREEEARARVDAERLRIAREVHDTVAHSIAIINVQAGVTAHILDRKPERAAETLRAIEDTSSRALQEMRSILGVLRDSHDGRAPMPGLDRIDDLAARARDAGLDVAVDARPPSQPLPRAVDSAAYRIVQESITNVIRHVGPTRVTLSLSHDVDGLEVRVVDEGSRQTTARETDSAVGTPTPGRGILGMRERCQLLGGELTAGPRPGGGFDVTARLPLAPVGSGH
jgi:signal transduction histidine kinase